MRDGLTRARAIVLWAAALGTAVSCSDNDPGVAVDLAPSQTSASTVAAPPLPPPCDPSVLQWATEPAGDAAIEHAGDTAPLFVVRVHNTGSVECELDVSGSAIADPAMEPDVWIAPGWLAEVLVIDGEPGCDVTRELDSIAVDANGTEVAVAVSSVVVGEWCQPTLAAIYPVEDG